MQCAIDNAKRTFDVDIPSEIKRIKNEIELKKNGYPAFWLVIRRGFNKEKINPKLVCPMNKVYDIRANKTQPSTPTLSVSEFFVNYKLDMNRCVSRNIEKLIKDYSLELYNYHLQPCDVEAQHNNFLILRDDFDKLIESIKRVALPNKYIGLMAWLINRAFLITPHTEAKQHLIQTRVNKNRAMLLKVLYTLNSSALLSIFGRHIMPIKD